MQVYNNQFNFYRGQDLSFIITSVSHSLQLCTTVASVVKTNVWCVIGAPIPTRAHSFFFPSFCTNEERTKTIFKTPQLNCHFKFTSSFPQAQVKAWKILLTSSLHQESFTQTCESYFHASQICLLLSISTNIPVQVAPISHHTLSTGFSLLSLLMPYSEPVRAFQHNHVSLELLTAAGITSKIFTWT